MKHRTLNTARFALTGVAVAASVLVSGQAWALGLGRLSVQSALGESLRAEIDVTQIAPEEASTLQTRVAAPDVYRAAGIDYNAALTGTKVALQRRADGRTVLVLSSDRAVVEPFLDVILELNWSSGRLVRAYTLLLDPPTLRPAPPVQATAPTAPAVSAAPPAPPTASPVRPQAPAPARAAAPAPMASPSGGSAAGTEQVRVASGDTLSRIASRVRPAGVSLDQMLVALFRANPDAFMGENMNRLKAGVVLDVPSGSEADSVSSGEARQIIVAQSADFDAYRRRLAGNVERTDEGAPTRQASGSVQAQVEDRSRPAATPPDKLTLAQAGSAASASETAVVSKQTEAREAAARVAELARNVEELKKLQGSSAAAASAGTAVATAPAAAPKPAPLPSAASAAVAMPMPASAPAEAAAPPPPPMAASTPAPAPKPAPKPAPAPAAEPEGGMLSSLLDNPLVLPLAGVLVLLLAGLGLYRLRGRMRKSGGSETSFLESRLQPDSFFGASGGQRIDTREAPSSTSSSSMSYSLSQLDAIGDVDPVAEADVYLAYGRDLQAEEILKEAMRATPDRQAIRLKLLEVYAKRRDTKAFELLATQLFSMTNGDGEDWVKAQELGRGIDPDNTLYQPGGQPDALMMQGGEIVEPLGASTMPHTQKPTSSLPPEVANLSADLDLDLDVDLEAPTQPVEPSVPRNEMTQPIPSDVQMGDDSSLDLPTDSKHGPLDFELPVGDLSEPPADPTVATPPPPPSDFGALDFELDVPPAEEPAAAPQDDRFPDFKASVPPDDTVPPSDFGNLTDDPLARKLELAEEFRQIGDLEGARDLLEEVISKSDGTVKAKAQGMLDRLA